MSWRAGTCWRCWRRIFPDLPPARRSGGLAQDPLRTLADDQMAASIAVVAFPRRAFSRFPAWRVVPAGGAAHHHPLALEVQQRLVAPDAAQQLSDPCDRARHESARAERPHRRQQLWIVRHHDSKSPVVRVRPFWLGRLPLLVRSRYTQWNYQDLCHEWPAQVSGDSATTYVADPGIRGMRDSENQLSRRQRVEASGLLTMRNGIPWPWLPR